ncbi:LysR family transcriptional regulator [Aquicoccus sp. SCR17]|nr:LysR family transcriptional regulator [Carideicomes alvinocaridis]
MIPKLEMLIALAKERHFGRAALSLGITQPTLSAGIRQLEDQLGVKLVSRGSRFGGLTPEGQRALVWARRIVGDARQLRDEMQFSREGLSGHLRLAVIPTALTWASRLATAFADRHPNVTFSVLSRSSVDILEMLDNLDCDAGISYLDNEPLGRVTTQFLYRETYRLICREDHPLAGRESVGWAELEGARLCLLTPDMQNRRIINRHFMEAGITPAAMIESNSTVVLVSNALQGWATILPTDLGDFLATDASLRSIPLTGGVAAPPSVGLIAPHQEPYTPVLKTLLEESRALARRDSR